MFLPEDKRKLFLTKWVPETGRSSCFCWILLHNPSPCLVLKQNLEWNRNEIFYLTTIMSLRESTPDPALTMLVTVLREDAALISLHWEGTQCVTWGHMTRGGREYRSLDLKFGCTKKSPRELWKIPGARTRCVPDLIGHWDFLKLPG